MKRMIFGQLLAVFVGFSLGAGEPAAWEKTAPTSLEDLLAIQKQVLKIREKVRAATVSVKMGRGAGSGVIVNKEGLVLTAGHVSGKPGRKFKIILPDGREFDGVALGNSPKTDSGMIQIKNPKDLPTVEYVGPSMPKRGQWCLAVGNMGGWDAKRGAVFRLGRVLAIKSRDTIQTDCKLLGGDSGGPLFDLEGRVIGIHSRIGRGPEMNFHVPMVAFHDDWKTMKDGKTTAPLDKDKRGYLGVRVSPEPDGARVTDVLPNTPAAKAGLKVGDLITHVSGRELFEGTGLPEIISSTEAGTEIEIRVERGNKALSLKAKLAPRAISPPPGEEKEDPDKKDKDDPDKKDKKEKKDEK